MRLTLIIAVFINVVWAQLYKAYFEDGSIRVIESSRLMFLQEKPIYIEKEKPLEYHDELLRGYCVGFFTSSPVSFTIAQGQNMWLWDFGANASFDSSCALETSAQDGSRRFRCSSITPRVTPSNLGAFAVSSISAFGTPSNALHLGTGVSLNSATGRGTYMAIVDSGFDICHPAYSSKIEFFYDVTTQTELNREQIEREISAGRCNKDPIGHGTAVASVASSIAPDARIIAIKTSDERYPLPTDAMVMRALDYITRKRQELGRPIVVNLSLGSDYGPGDGMGMFTLAIERALGPGLILVASAGNSGSRPNRAILQNPTNVTIPITFNDGGDVEVWFPQSSNYRVEVCHPRTGACAFSSESTSRREIACIDYIKRERYPTNQKTVVSFFSRCVGSLDLRIVLEGGQPGVVTIFVSSFDTLPANTRQRDEFGSFYHSISEPADGRRIIAVGSIVIRPDRNSQELIGRVARFSARGPTIDGRVKPDLVAGGQTVFVARIGGGYTFNSGTSFSSPVVTGVVARLLEANPNLTPEQVKEVLCTFATKDQAVGAVPNNQYGCGKVFLAS
ncbi:MAG: S8 family serine peptidase, partial [Aquificaceae bacterium]|nr:S8 family serine peptidase [Aquificaceae bacterium]MDW8237437.1 S8 family serine peptidase [Aquificaceae bacterium]